ncbi:hypothetical protein [Streptomyces phaeoluteigriseus]|uniref:hypothetical protein n=1 Tax=Streptomyces phaeoluteigriseus TaxID=114686 RepID=UPI000928059F|nr:hypothetical protein [Streptomyces phaeoluteigriseus]
MGSAVARMLARYIVDQHRYLGSDDEAVLPAVPAESARPDDEGWTDDEDWTALGRFLAPGEAHADFEHTQPHTSVRADPEDLLAVLPKGPAGVHDPLRPRARLVRLRPGAARRTGQRLRVPGPRCARFR